MTTSTSQSLPSVGCGQFVSGSIPEKGHDFYEFIPPSSYSQVIVSTCGSEFRPEIFIYEGANDRDTAPARYRCSLCGSCGQGIKGAEQTFTIDANGWTKKNLIPGDTYTIGVSGRFASDYGSYELRLSCSNPPTPSSQSAPQPTVGGGQNQNQQQQPQATQQAPRQSQTTASRSSSESASESSSSSSEPISTGAIAGIVVAVVALCGCAIFVGFWFGIFAACLGAASSAKKTTQPTEQDKEDNDENAQQDEIVEDQPFLTSGTPQQTAVQLDGPANDEGQRDAGTVS